VKEKKSPNIRIKANEREVSPYSHITLLKLKDLFKPNANVIIYSGLPLSSGRPLKQGYEIGLIRKGEIPSSEEFVSLLVLRHPPGIDQKVKSSGVGITGLDGLQSRNCCLPSSQHHAENTANGETERQHKYQE